MMGINEKAELKQAANLAEAGEYQAAYSLMRKICSPSADFSRQHHYHRVGSKIQKANLGLEPIRVAILATSTIDHFATIFQLWLFLRGFDAEFYLADFDTVDQTILDSGSGLYGFEPDVIWLFTSYRDVTNQDDGVDTAPSVYSLDRFHSWWHTLQNSCTAHIIQNNVDLPAERGFGNFAGQATTSRLNRLRRFNGKLAESALSGVTIFDIDYLSSLYGKKDWANPRYWYHSKHAITLNAVGLVANEGAAVVCALKGRAKKCLVLDLDNTLWGGVIGDDGIDGITLGDGPVGEAFVDFQRYVRRLKNRGIILAVCSKNDESNAQLPFKNHPNMVLRLDDISVFVANWDNKAENISLIAETLEIGLDSIVFVDDNPAERSLVSQLIPDVAVPNLPEEPEQYISFLDSHRYFETVSYSKEDAQRSDMYRSNIERKREQKAYGDLDDFLKSLDMKCVISNFDSQNIPRVAQLVNKSNQFHLTTTRYSESAISDLVNDDNYVCRCFKLSDKFGDNGIICLVILKINAVGEAVVDTWVMSCRVLSRGVEKFVQNEIEKLALERNATIIVGQYIPSKKNRLVEKLYQRLGYRLVDDVNGATTWHFALPHTGEKQAVFIEPVDSY